MSQSSAHWKRRQARDLYVKRARANNYRSRAVFKLMELDHSYRLFKKGNRVIDLGAAPGSWSQYIQRKVGQRGQVVACDLLPVQPLHSVVCIQGDFTRSETQARLFDALKANSVDAVVSDLAPGLSGIGIQDQANAQALAEKAKDFALSCLKPGGHFVTKLFSQPDLKPWLNSLERHFERVHTAKPEASRSSSSEIYAVALRRRLAE